MSAANQKIVGAAGAIGNQDLRADLQTAKQAGKQEGANGTVDNNPAQAQIVKPPPQNRYEKQLEKKFKDVGTGETIQNLLLYKSGWRDNFPKRLKLFILKEYWTGAQVWGIFLVGLWLGILVMLSVILSSFDEIDYNLFDARGFWRKLGVFLTSFAGGIALSKTVPKGLRRCQAGHEGTQKGFENQKCISDADCSFIEPISGSCRYPDGGWLMTTLRYVSYGLSIAGIVILVVNKTGLSLQDMVGPTSYDIWISSLLGISIAQILSYIMYV